MIAAAECYSTRVKASIQKNRKRLREAIQKAWLPRDPSPPAEWSQKHLKLDPTREATSAYDLTRRPWYRDILNFFSDAEVRSICFPAATQIGKTLLLIASIIWVAQNAPAPGMVVLPDRDAAIEFRDRVYADALETLRRSPADRLRIPPEHDWNTRYIDLGSMRVYLAWSGSKQRLRGRPCRYVWLSEIDVYKGDKRAGNPIKAAQQRTKAFFRGLHYYESSPVEYPSSVCALERSASARYRWHCECPTCGRWQELRFFTHTKGPLAGKGGIGGLKNADGEFVKPEQGRKEGHYVCEGGCKLGNDQKQAFIERGVWVPVGAKVRSRDARGKPIIEGKLPTSRREIGVHLWSVHSEAITFGDLASEYLKAREDGTLPEFFGNWLGLEWKAETKLPTWSELGQRMAWTHPRGTVPAEAWFLTASCDVQGENNGVRVSVRAWGPECTSWLVDWFWIDREPGDENDLVKSDLKKMEQLVLNGRFPIADGKRNIFGRRELGVKLLLIDSNYLPMKVHNWMRSLPESWTKGEKPRVRAIRGDKNVKPEMRWRMNVVEQNSRTNEVYEGGMQQWGIYVYPFYDELTQKLQSSPGKPGAWYVTADTLQQGRSYLEQVVNFGRRVQIDPKTGKKKAVWDAITGRIPVDYWDTEIYNLVAANMVVEGVGWTTEAFEKWREKLIRLSERRRPAADPQTPRRPQRPSGEDPSDLGAR